MLTASQPWTDISTAVSRIALDGRIGKFTRDRLTAIVTAASSRGHTRPAEDNAIHTALKSLFAKSRNNK